jgi:hypothetical protein
LLAHVPDDWRGVFAAALYTGMRKGELFGLRKSDVDLHSGIITVARSYDRDTTKGAHADAIPIAPPLVPFLLDAMRSPGELVFPAPEEEVSDASETPRKRTRAVGAMRSEEADPQKVLRNALGRAGIVEGYDHICRRCKAQDKPHTERHQDAELRTCVECEMKLWPKAIPRPMRFHDLRHTTATLLLRAGVDTHRVQRILRHSDVRTTTGTYGHLDVEDLRGAMDLLAPIHGQPVFADAESERSRDRRSRTVCYPFATHARIRKRRGPRPRGFLLWNRGPQLVGETGFEPATPWSRTRCSTRLSHSPTSRRCYSGSLLRGAAWVHQRRGAVNSEKAGSRDPLFSA